MKFPLFLLAFLSICLPFSAHASSIRPGTDDYLRSIGWAEERLSTEGATELRNPFQLAEGEGVLKDPSGDVLSRLGVTSKVNEAWGDIVKTDVTKNEAIEAWEVRITTAAPIPSAPPAGTQANFFVLFDADGMPENNAFEGVMIAMDSEFRVLFNSESKSWETSYRWYNRPVDFWAADKKTTMTFEFNGPTLLMRIPFSEVPASAKPAWRAQIALQDGKNTQVDVIPEIGFPALKGTDYAENASPNDWKTYILLLGAGLLILTSPMIIKKIKRLRNKKPPA